MADVMEAAVGSAVPDGGEPTKGSQQQQQLRQRPEDEEHARTCKRQRTLGSAGHAAGAEDPAAEAVAPTGGSGGSGEGVATSASSPEGGSEGVRAERAAEAPPPPPCMGGDQEEVPSEPQQGPGSPEIIVIDDDDDDEEEKDREFEREIALLKAEIARLEALAKELQSQGGEQ